MNKSAFEIKEAEITKNATNAFNTLQDCTVKIIDREDGHIPPSQRGFSSAVSHRGDSGSQKKFNIKRTIENINPDVPLASPVQHEIISALHRGISIASVIAQKFEDQRNGRAKTKIEVICTNRL